MLSRVLAALSAALLLALTACGSTDEPAASTPDGDDAVPAYADNPGEAGAEQFVGFWTDILNEATASGDTEPLRALASQECQACSDFAGQLDSIYEAGGRVESDGWAVGKIVPEAGASDNEVGLLVTFQVAPQKVFATEDAKAETFEGGNQAFRFHLVRGERGWQVQDLTPR